MCKKKFDVTAQFKKKFIFVLHLGTAGAYEIFPENFNSFQVIEFKLDRLQT